MINKCFVTAFGVFNGINPLYGMFFVFSFMHRGYNAIENKNVFISIN